MSSAPVMIPYEKQADTKSTRMCGAACLAMVYRSFGKEVTQEEIWPAISKVNRFGSLASTTHLMTQHALGKELAAVAFQARHPIQALRLCREAGARAILNHRPEPNSPNGHYSVMVDLDSKNVYLHDPYYGPARGVSHDDLLDLWQPKFARSEIVGGVLIAIAEAPKPVPPCQFCRTPFPATIECPNCRKPVGLKPATVLGCMNENCIARMWNYINCPFCDFMWNSSSSIVPVAAGVPAEAEPAGALPGTTGMPPAHIELVLESIDKFMAEVKRIPGVANSNLIQEQLTRLEASKADIRQGFNNSEAHAKAAAAQMATFQSDVAARAEACAKRAAEYEGSKPKPAESLDGVALGKALLKNLGFTQ